MFTQKINLFFNQFHAPADNLRANYSFKVLKLVFTNPMQSETTYLSASLEALAS